MTIVDQQHQKEGEGALAVGWAQHGFVADSIAERGVGDNSLSWSFKVRSKNYYNNIDLVEEDSQCRSY